MSRLDAFVHRVTAQRALLNAARAQLADVPGVVFELGLGNGRTFDHLRENFSDRPIFVFEKEVRAHPDCIPDENQLRLGDIDVTLGQAAEEFRGRVALIHSDLGSHSSEHCARMAEIVSANAPTAMAPGALLFSDLALHCPELEKVTPPDGIGSDWYHAFRNPAHSGR